MLRSIFLPILFLVWWLPGFSQVQNFAGSGEQVTKFDQLGNAVDAHDGMIAYFGDTYYLYGTSYDCGFEWNNKTAPFCGFKVYSSKDLSNWKDEGFLFDARNPLWQQRCDGKTYGCFRPHVVYNHKKKNYVLWINVYDNVIGYRVFTSESPVGPFLEAPEPRLVINSDKPAAGLNNGDHDLFVDDNGIAYLAFTDWRAKGAIAIEQLTDDYLSGTGITAGGITDSKTEAPALFKRRGLYYITYSDPNCGYCSGTGTSYKTASAPLGPWSEAHKINDNSCGGQPSFVSTIKLPGDTIFLYGSDLWNNAAKNEALANFYWMPLQFEADGTIQPFKCLDSFNIRRENTRYSNAKTYKALCGITPQAPVVQEFSAERSGRLATLDIAVLKSGNPNAGLIVELFEQKAGKRRLLWSTQIAAEVMGWSARNVRHTPGIQVKKKAVYQLVLRTEAEKGCYGYAKQLTGMEKPAVPQLKFGYTIR